MAVATSEASARVGVGAVHHRFQHLGRDDHRLALQPAQLHQLLLPARHVLVRDLDAEIAAGHHDRVGQADDVLDPFQGLRLLDLGEQGRLAADQPARLDQVGGLLDEGERDEIDPELEPEGEILAVLGGQRREVEGGVGQVDALAVADRAADHDPGLDRLGLERDRLQPHPAVVDQQRGTRA